MSEKVVARKKEKGAGQTKYIVTVAKTFEFPSCIINKSNRVCDLFSKAWEQYLEFVHSNPERIKSQMKITLDSEVPFVLSSNYKSDGQVYRTTHGMQVDCGYFAKMAAEARVEEIFGALDPETNPEIYIERPREVLDKNGNVVETEVDYELKEEVLRKYHDYFDHYVRIFRVKV